MRFGGGGAGSEIKRREIQQGKTKGVFFGSRLERRETDVSRCILGLGFAGETILDTAVANDGVGSASALLLLLAQDEVVDAADGDDVWFGLPAPATSGLAENGRAFERIRVEGAVGGLGVEVDPDGRTRGGRRRVRRVGHQRRRRRRGARRATVVELGSRGRARTAMYLVEAVVADT